MELKAGAICGNPLAGLCQRVVIEVKQVFDGCVLRLQNENLILPLDDFSPGATPPYTYVRAENSGNTVISGLVTTPLDGGRCRFSLDLTCPVTVYFTDALGNPSVAHSNFTAHRDVVLKIPEPNLATYSLEAATALVSMAGAFTSDSTVNINCCIVQTIKVVLTVDLLVPAYCYARYPDCSDYSENLCQGLFSLPLFPTNHF